MANTDKVYRDLVNDVMENGSDKADRTGVGTRSVFGRIKAFDVLGWKIPMLTCKYVHFKSVLHELLWFLSGDTDIKYLVDNDVRIWDDWPYSAFLDTQNTLRGSDIVTESFFEVKNIQQFRERIKNDQKFAEIWGRVGPIYGAQMTSWRRIIEHSNGRDFDIERINQVAKVIDDIKNNPDSRRHLVTMWNPGELEEMILPPCHYSFQFYSSELSEEDRARLRDMDLKADTGKRRLDILFNMRSVDVFLGYPFDIASYGILLAMVARATNHTPGRVIIVSGDTHIYKNHFDAVNTLLDRPEYDSEPVISFRKGASLDPFKLKYDDIELVGYNNHGKIKAPVAV